MGGVWRVPGLFDMTAALGVLAPPNDQRLGHDDPYQANDRHQDGLLNVSPYAGLFFSSASTSAEASCAVGSRPSGVN